MITDAARQPWHTVCAGVVLAQYQSKAGRPRERRGQLALAEVIGNEQGQNSGGVAGVDRDAGGAEGLAGAEGSRESLSLLPQSGCSVSG
jgi:hypothetical protein